MTAIDVANEIRSLKRDLEAVLDNHGQAKMRFFICAPNHGFRDCSPQWFPLGESPPDVPSDTDHQVWTELYEDIATEVDGIRSSYFAPALHFNNYLEWSAIDIEWDETKYELKDDDPRPSNILRRVAGEAYATAVLISIKSGLDRLVRVLSYYYPGIAKHTTWGRFDKNGKPTGFMAVVDKGMANDGLLADLNSAYSRWIQVAVAPRDTLIHYRDSVSVWHFLPEEGAHIQSHSVVDADGQIHNYGIDALSTYVDEWYQFADRVLLTLATRLPRVRLTGRSNDPKRE